MNILILPTRSIDRILGCVIFRSPFWGQTVLLDFYNGQLVNGFPGITIQPCYSYIHRSKSPKCQIWPDIDQVVLVPRWMPKSVVALNVYSQKIYMYISHSMYIYIYIPQKNIIIHYLYLNLHKTQFEAWLNESIALSLYSLLWYGTKHSKQENSC